jgi:UDP-2,4-diacetamido-2,4,6-trideoxy-beta-L-altropyranose hydrolase
MRVAIRVDASTWIGTGHVARCATLAAEMRRRGTEVVFYCRHMPGDRTIWLEQQGYRVNRLAPVIAPVETVSPIRHAGWLGIDPSFELAEMAGLLAQGEEAFDWLVVDHYGLGADWERGMRRHCKHVLVIDDLADRNHDCDLLLDQNLVQDMDSRYTESVGDCCRKLLGPRFALLQPDFAAWRGRTAPKVGPVRRILVFFGGADASHLAGTTLRAIQNLGHKDLQVDLVIGADHPRRDELALLAGDIPGVVLHRNLPTLAPLMAGADLAIGAGGVTSWERCCLGLPSLIVTLAQNQLPIARALDARGLARRLGDVADMDVDRMTAAIGDLVGRGISVEQSNACRDLVDGNGVGRVVAAIEARGDMPLVFREAAGDDETILLEWANDPVVRSNAFAKEIIENSTHRRWFQARINDRAGCRIRVAETACGVPVGQVRLELREGAWLIGYSIDAAFRGLGLGKRLLAGALGRHAGEFSDFAVYGLVKEGNPASCRVFEALGFSRTNAGEGVREYRMQVRRNSFPQR